ncbi:hypothetical protein [Ralstonia sp. SET104]|uniref:hypothetical protein n=1 Tax=Ralstonia sp. SET104 TaxID=2448774 RepID=UPI000F569AF7|nr:hypothetical protein [Ralstonia sp. SET104]GCB02601.1 hypothetical protein PSUB009319_02320 [Ralstonia sp. SET104]
MDPSTSPVEPKPFEWLDLDMLDRDPLAAVGALGLPPLPALLLPLQRALRVLLGRNLPPVDALKRDRISRELLADPTALAMAIASIVVKFLQAIATTPTEGTLSVSDALDALHAFPEMVAADASQLDSLFDDVVFDWNPGSHVGKILVEEVPGEDWPILRLKILDELPFSLDIWDLAALAVLALVDCSVRLYQRGNHDQALIGYSAAASLSHAMEYLHSLPGDAFYKVMGVLTTVTDSAHQRVNSQRGAEAKRQQKTVRWAQIKQHAIRALERRTDGWKSVNEALRTLDEVAETMQGELSESTYKKILGEIRQERPALFVPRRRRPSS